jgi:anaerobic ribonucleoside-triphosphate reductase
MDGKRQLCQIYSRVVGWMTPLKNWNPGKQSEWLERKVYNTKKYDK